MNSLIDIKLPESSPKWTLKSLSTKLGLGYLWKSLPRTLLALNFTLTLSTFMTAMQAVTDNRAIAAGLHRQAEDPLPDLLMDWTVGAKFIPMYAADLLLNSLIAFTIGCFIFSWRWRVQRYGLDEGHYRTLRIARKFFWMLGFAYLFRSLSLLSTTMPPTDSRCIYKQRTWKQIPFTALEIMTKQGNTCSDKIFSGHSSMATLVCLFWLGALLRPDRKEQISPNDAVPIPLWRKLAAVGIVTWTSLVYIFCVLCRNHYSIDIIVAIFVCTGIFSTFQLSLKIIELDQHKARNLDTSLSTGSGLMSVWPNNQHSYTPLTNDPEVGFESPQIHMTEIKQLEDDFKPRLVESHVKLQVNPTVKRSYVPYPFLLLLRAIAWMDGSDLK